MAPSAKSKVRDNVGDEHDDGLWPDYETSTESVRPADNPERVSAARDTEITESKSGKKSD